MELEQNEGMGVQDASERTLESAVQCVTTTALRLRKIVFGEEPVSDEKEPKAGDKITVLRNDIQRTNGILLRVAEKLEIL